MCLWFPAGLFNIFLVAQDKFYCYPRICWKFVAMNLFLILVLSALSFLSVVAQVEDVVAPTSKDLIFSIEHSFGDGTFASRTKIHLVKKPDGKHGLLFPERNGVFGEEVDSIKGLLKSNELYTIRIQSHFGDYSSKPILTSIPAVNEMIIISS